MFWCGLLVGVGVGLQLAAVFVEWGWLSPQSKAWATLAGGLLAAAAVAAAVVKGRRTAAGPDAGPPAGPAP